MKTALLIFSILLVLSASGAASDASRMTLPSGMDNPMTIRFPQLATAAAPPAIEEGLRATYQMITGSPESETGGDIEFVGGDAGVGLAQVTVVALEAGKAATWTVAFAPDATLGAMKRVNSYGTVNPAGCGDFWCNPQVLETIPEKADDDLTVTRGTYELNGKIYNVIRFNFQSNQGIALSMVYDLKSGIMLYHTADYSSSLPTDAGGRLTRSQNAILKLVNLRAVDIPWKDGKVPDWARPGATLSYQGRHSFWLPQLPDVAPTVSSIGSELSIQAAHSRYAEGRQQTYTEEAMQPPYVPMVSGVAQLMGFWVPEEALSLTPGAVDYDPDTGMTTSVQQSGPDGVVMEETNGVSYRLTATYDARGMLTGTVTESYTGTASGQKDELLLVG
ncbi:MAG: hypothetical protein A4E49_01738 [Methanosaeta sp. PtaU1.Bin112]|nr:MAG: hypothetical protein A4E49_01738 [Methanosaeta sp. PtaU1.Bin112]